MANKLQEYFSMIQTKEAIMEKIENDRHLKCMFEEWGEKHQQEVHIIEVLPGDSARIADESSLVIMDIVVQLKDGSIANLEIQKIGYKFPGERSSCYSADLLLRQYKRVRSKRKD